MFTIAKRSVGQFTFQSRYCHWTTLNDLNPKLLAAQYAVRGKVPTAADQIQHELQTPEGRKRYPFDSTTELNIGNPQAFGQPPITFNREVLSCLINKDLLNSPSISQDAKNRARQYQENIGASLGAYSASAGFSLVREQVASFKCSFIQRRDGTKSKPAIEHIFLSDGASQAIHLGLAAMIQNNKDGIMIPIPQYPLYTASIALNGGTNVPYYLDESKGWQVSINELEEQYQRAQQQGIRPKVIVVINPGNPTGQVLDKQTIEDILKFASDKKVTVFADEVYQSNVYVPHKKFHSMRQIKESLPPPYNDVELYSFHSISKGISGECGFRGGYCEISSVDPQVFAEISKSKTIVLCSNTAGQVLTGLLVHPPSKEDGCSDATVDKFHKECDALFKSLARRSAIVQESLNSIKGVRTQDIEGAMYAFPSLDLSDKFIAHAKSQGFAEADEFYCMEALKNTGLVFVPGSGFLQQENTHHFRTTTLILPEEKLHSKLKSLKDWHEKFMQKF